MKIKNDFSKKILYLILFIFLSSFFIIKFKFRKESTIIIIGVLALIFYYSYSDKKDIKTIENFAATNLAPSQMTYTDLNNLWKTTGCTTDLPPNGDYTFWKSQSLTGLTDLFNYYNDISTTCIGPEDHIIACKKDNDCKNTKIVRREVKLNQDMPDVAGKKDDVIRFEGNYCPSGIKYYRMTTVKDPISYWHGGVNMTTDWKNAYTGACSATGIGSYYNGKWDSLSTTVTLDKRECNLLPGVRLPGAGHKLGSSADQIAPYPATVSSEKECSDKCLENPNCKQFVKYGNSCYLMSNSYAYNSSDNSADYYSGQCADIIPINKTYKLKVALPDVVGSIGDIMYFDGFTCGSGIKYRNMINISEALRRRNLPYVNWISTNQPDTWKNFYIGKCTRDGLGAVWTNYLDDYTFNKTLAEYQSLFNTAGCNRILTEADIAPLKNMTLDNVALEIIKFYNFSNSCSGTDAQNDVCMTNKCKMDCVPQAQWTFGTCNKQTGKRPKTKGRAVIAKNSGRDCTARQLAEEESCTVNCETTWTNYSTCDKNIGTKYRDPVITIQPKNGGTTCPTRETVGCPVECEVSNWTNDTCNQETGRYIRRRLLNIKKRNDQGQEIPCEKPLQEEMTCSTECKVSPWTSTSCNQATGRYMKSRSITQNKRNDAGQVIQCEKPLEEEMTCPTQCLVSPWTNGPCNQATGRYMKSRTITQNKRNDAGQVIQCEKPLQEEMTCPTECKTSSWISDQCDQSTGRYLMNRSITQNKRNAAGVIVECDKNLQEEKTCATQCLVSPWTSDPCNPATGKYMMRRSKTQEKRNAAGQVIACEKPLQEEMTCPTECKVGNWVNGACNNATGRHIKTRTITQKKRNAAAQEIPCEKPLQEEATCPTQCLVSSWVSEPCNQETGRYTMRRTITQKKRNVMGQEIACEKPIQEEMRCATQCLVTPWTTEPCNQATGRYMKRRTISQKKRGPNGQEIPCEKPLQEEMTCATQCLVSPWLSDECDEAKGKFKMRRTIIQKKRNAAGQEIPCEKILQEEMPCGANCRVSSWTSEPCNPATGRYLMKRNKTQEKRNATGQIIPCEKPLQEEKTCPTQCLVGPWTTGECNPATGRYLKERQITQYKRNAAGEVISCEKPLQEEMPCPTECKVSNWVNGQCNPAIGSYIKTRQVTQKKRNASGNEIPCEKPLEEEARCPTECKVSEWANGPCDPATGRFIKTRTISQRKRNAAGQVIPCEKPLAEEATCATECKVSSWTDGPCDQNTGRYIKTRTITQKKRNAAGQVIACEKPLEEEATCAVECQMSNWSYGKCDEKTGKITKTRKVVINKRNAAGEIIQCEKPITGIDNCSVECKVGDWSFGQCNKNTGIRINKREITTQKMNDRNQIEPCPIPLTEEETCPVRCEVSDWEIGNCNPQKGRLIKTRKVTVKERDNKANIMACDIPLTEEEPCPVKCLPGNWENGQCIDRIGIMTKTRKPLVQERNSKGEIIPCSEDLREEEPCAVKCQVSDWVLGNCDPKTGTIKKTRKVTVQERNNQGIVVKCDKSLIGEEQCNVDCKVYDWSPKKCDRMTGVQTRTRKTDPPFNNGKPCPPESELVEKSNCYDTIDAEENKCYWKDNRYCILKGYSPDNGFCKSDDKTDKGNYNVAELGVDEFKEWLRERVSSEPKDNEVYDYWTRCKDITGYDFLKGENFMKKEPPVVEEEVKTVMKYDDIIANAYQYAIPEVMVSEENIGPEKDDVYPDYISHEENVPTRIRRSFSPRRRITKRIDNESLLRPVSTIQRERDIDYNLGYGGADTNMQYYNNGDVNTLLNNYVI